jgi:hypothetical protein
VFREARKLRGNILQIGIRLLIQQAEIVPQRTFIPGSRIIKDAGTPNPQTGWHSMSVHVKRRVG